MLSFHFGHCSLEANSSVHVYIPSKDAGTGVQDVRHFELKVLGTALHRSDLGYWFVW